MELKIAKPNKPEEIYFQKKQHMKLKISILTKINTQLKPELSKRAKRKLGVILGKDHP